MVRVQPQSFDIGAEIDALRNGDARIGALATFVGCMRDVNDGDNIRALHLEHYPGMTERGLAEIEREARTRWNLIDMVIVHRVGTLHPSDPIVLVIAAARHRNEAFSACEFTMDYLKTRAPFWKREHTARGTRWLGARVSDSAAAARWERADERRCEPVDGE